MSCKAMFEQVDATFQKGMAEHSAAVQQRLESTPTSLAMTLRVSNSECLFLLGVFHRNLYLFIWTKCLTQDILSS